MDLLATANCALAISEYLNSEAGIMDGDELYALRAKDFARRWENHRCVEWEINLEVYSGYAAIAYSYWHLYEKFGPSFVLVWGAHLITLVLFATTTYLFLRVQERMHMNADMMKVYFRALHKSLRCRELCHPFNTGEPSHKKWYAFGAQVVLTYCVALALLVYQAATAPMPYRLWIQVPIWLAQLVVACALWQYAKRLLLFPLRDKGTAQTGRGWEYLLTGI